MTKRQKPETRPENLIRDLKDSILNSPGDTDPSLRQCVEARAAAHGGRSMTNVLDIPGILTGYVDKVALYAYKVTDGDVTALKDAGYSEDAIFEFTLSAALGAGLVRLERGMAALKGEV